MADILGGIVKMLFPPAAGVMNDDAIDEAYNRQETAGLMASNDMKNQFNYIRGQNEPLIQIGDEQLQNLRSGIANGTFLPDESAFQSYNLTPQQNYQAPDRYQQQDADPGQIQYSQTQFSPYQSQQQQPNFYRTPDIGEGNYYDPNQQQFSVADDPVYQNRIAAANKATEASGAARGMQLSGATLKALQDNASTNAGDEGAAAYGRYADQQNRLQSAMNYQNQDEYNRALAMSGIRTGEADRAVGQYNLNRDFGQQSNTQNLANALAVQGQNYGQYNTNRGFDYGTFQDYNANQFAGLQYNNQLAQAQDTARYGLLTDQYNRSANRGLTDYGMIGDIANLGMTGRQNLGTAAGDYWGSQADIGIGTANAFAAAQAAKSGNDGILNSLLGK